MRQVDIGDLCLGSQKQKFQQCTMDLKTHPLQMWTQVFRSNRGISWSDTQGGAAVVLESAVSMFPENSLIKSGQHCCFQQHPSAE